MITDCFFTAQEKSERDEADGPAKARRNLIRTFLN